MRNVTLIAVLVFGVGCNIDGEIKTSPVKQNTGTDDLIAGDSKPDSQCLNDCDPNQKIVTTPSPSPSVTPITRDFTPVVLIFGGYASCLSTAGQDDEFFGDPLNGGMRQILDRTEEKLGRISYLITCYHLDGDAINPFAGPTDPGDYNIEDINYRLSGADDFTVGSESQMLAELRAWLRQLDKPKLFVYAHSHGAWAAIGAMLELRNEVSVGSIYAIDAISKPNCQAGNFLFGTGECQQAPSDFADADLTDLASKTDTFVHAYQQGNGELIRSSPLTGADNHLKTYTDAQLDEFRSSTRISTILGISIRAHTYIPFDESILDAFLDTI